MAIFQARRLLGAGALAAVAAVPVPAHAAGTDVSVVKRVNTVRARHGLPALRISHALDRAAAAHCQAMASGGSLTHGTLESRLEQYASASTFGETIAWMPTPSPAAVVRAWLRSPPHRAVLLSGQFHRIGVAAQAARMGGRSGTTYTADLAG